MVGVPSSRGCRNCRRKKKGCDLVRPTCARCAHLGYDCTYDDKRWTFVGHKVPPAESSRASSATSAVQATTELQRVTPPQGPSQRSLSRTAWETQWAGQFWTHFLPQEDPSTVFVGNVRIVPWMGAVMDMAAKDATARMALNAVAFTIIGRAKSDQSLVRESTRLYSVAIRETSRALQDVNKARSDEILACCKILALYENFRVKDTPEVSTQGFDWHSHIDGTQSLIEMRGPARHSTDHGHVLFKDIRIMTATSSITRRKPSEFTNPVWSVSWYLLNSVLDVADRFLHRHTTPFETSPKSLHDELVDIMLTLPELLAEQDNLNGRLAACQTAFARFEAFTAGQNLLYRCINMGEQLNEWQHKVLRESAAVSPTPASTSNTTIADICMKHGYGLFNCITQCWVTCLILYSTTRIIHRTLTYAAQGTRSGLPEIPPWMNPYPMAMCIASHAHHYFEDSARYWGASIASFPLGIVAHYCAASGNLDSECMTELRRLYRMNDRGQLTLEFLRSIANTGSPVKGDPVNPDMHRKMATAWYRISEGREGQSPPEGRGSLQQS
ncbi:uncharacterized protein LTR77_004802 [Saxophila tyrrhenica]|uniref:Zn(2)-C6 fungal-type domain-containing protein n=1 Tax=Saxophila tyrrhenica TaxID=1690608 RepID=A0AAV9PAJ3_9PEZI|nr:hypothetical protein LTR77_004802 [Saxophila tyrrhenica]